MYRAARAECRKPGARIAQIMRVYFEHWFDPATFGARVLTDWTSRTDEERARFEKAADAKLLAPARAREIAAFCDKRDEFQYVRDTNAGATQYQHIMITHYTGRGGYDIFQVGWVLVERDGQWSLDHVEVPSMDYPGIDKDPVDQRVRMQLGDYEHAMKTLAN
jgi:hypothetical protein